METLIADIPPTLATFVLAILVLVAGVGLALAGITKSGPESIEHDKEKMKYIFTAVGVLFGLLAAGGLGSLFARQAADSSAENAAAATKDEIAKELPGQVQEAVDDSVPEAVKGAITDQNLGQGKP